MTVAILRVNNMIEIEFRNESSLYNQKSLNPDGVVIEYQSPYAVKSPIFENTLIITFIYKFYFYYYPGLMLN